MTLFERNLYKTTETLCNNFKNTHSTFDAQNFKDLCWGVDALYDTKNVSEKFYSKWSEKFGEAWEESADYSMC